MCTHNQCFEQKKEKSYNLSPENNHFYSRKILLYLVMACLRNVDRWIRNCGLPQPQTGTLKLIVRFSCI